jgi:hypothetical protein
MQDGRRHVAESERGSRIGYGMARTLAMEEKSARGWQRIEIVLVTDNLLVLRVIIHMDSIN